MAGSGHIKGNWIEIKGNIAEAAKKAGVPAEGVTIVAVSKTYPPEYIDAAAALGIGHFGESRAQELSEKFGRTENPVSWHMIGHLQTNKVKYIIDKVALIQSVDSLRLAAEIDRQAGLRGIIADYLIEVNIAGEASKYGVPPEEAVSFAESLAGFGNIRVKGLMCIAPFAEPGKEEGNRRYFNKMRELYERLGRVSGGNVEMSTLSMGMTCDYKVAVEEGSNMVRVGTGLFGSR